MFIQHKNLKSLSIPASKVTHLHAASSSVQLAFAGFPPQLCSAYLVWVSSGDKSLIVIGFYMNESERSIFFVPKSGEVLSSQALDVYQEGLNFVESMGFVLGETDFHLMAAAKKERFWASLPISQLPKNLTGAGQAEPSPVENAKIRESRELSLISLGRFLAGM